jgi:TetR/AcrR family fatty acid metabolism transcriptional regulator
MAARADADHHALANEDVIPPCNITVYRYFGGKDDLLLWAFREAVHDCCGAARDNLSPVLPFPRRLARFIRLQFERIEGNPALATVLLVESRQTAQFYRGAVREVLRTYADAIEELLRSGVREGAVRESIDIPLTRRMLIGVLEEVELEWLLSDRSQPLVPVADAVADTLLRGLGQRAPG